MTFKQLLDTAAQYQITENTARANAQSVFVCIRGAHVDGHDLAQNAYRNGCRHFVAEVPLRLPADATVITSPSTRTALAQLACKHYGEPSRRLRVIGITGTKGKTTTALLLHHILNGAGIPCGYIGTNGISVKEGQLQVTANTTPDAVTLQGALRDMVDAGCQAAVVEVSSQALKQERVFGTTFDTTIFTNLSPDHIGPTEHPDLADYAACKQKLFTDYPCQTVLCNIDDPFAGALLSATHAPHRLTCGISARADFSLTNVTPYRDGGVLGICFCVESRNAAPQVCRLPLIGQGNAYNALLAIACAAECFGIPLSRSTTLLETVTVPGRSETICLPNGALAIIDYAHNGVSLRQLLTDLRAYTPKRLLLLIGSVGERTKLRRQEIGAVAGALADLCIFTSDNPGREDPAAIVQDIAAGARTCKIPALQIPDREEAIRQAVDRLQPNDFLVLAGKGHERYQLIGTEKCPFCEKEILLSYAQKKEAESNAFR